MLPRSSFSVLYLLETSAILLDRYRPDISRSQLCFTDVFTVSSLNATMNDESLSPLNVHMMTPVVSPTIAVIPTPVSDPQTAQLAASRLTPHIASESTLTTLHILLVDSDASSRSAIGELLRKNGNIVTSCPTSVEAFQQLAVNSSYSLILKDYSPNSNADACRFLRRLKALGFAHIPVVGECCLCHHTPARYDQVYQET